VENLAHSASFHSREKIAPSNPGIKQLGKFRDSPITRLVIAGTRPPFIIVAARANSLGASSAKGASVPSTWRSSASRSGDATAARVNGAEDLFLRVEVEVEGGF
jgi:hypothetical protein